MKVGKIGSLVAVLAVSVSIVGCSEGKPDPRRAEVERFQQRFNARMDDLQEQRACVRALGDNAEDIAKWAAKRDATLAKLHAERAALVGKILAAKP